MREMTEKQSNASILFFDGPCLLCQKSVQWIIRHERLGNSLLFSPLQGEAAHMHLPAELRTPPLQGVVFISEKGQIYHGAKAVRALSPLLKNPWGLLARFMPHWGYQFIATRRHLLFERREETCLVDPDIRQRILD
jgi:predicted DCC family thiol-disulfide oxidoreductase YuxK